MKSIEWAGWPSLLLAICVDTALAWGVIVGAVLLLPGWAAITVSAGIAVVLVCVYSFLNLRASTLGALLSGIRWRQADGGRLSGLSAFVLALVEVLAGPLVVVLAVFLAGVYPGGLPSARQFPIGGVRVRGTAAFEAADRYWTKWE